MSTGIHRLYLNYLEAESDCDQIAGDNELHMVVIERFDLEHPGEFAAVVINAEDVDDYIRDLDDDDWERIYEADQTEATRERMA